MSTVSRVLNNDTSRGVSEAKRKQVLAVAELIGYRPHRSARALRTGRHMNIAYVLAESAAARSNLELPFARFRLYGIEDVLTERGYLLSLVRLDPVNPQSLRERVLQWRHIDGLVFNFSAPSRATIDLLREARLPAVLLDGDIFEESGRTLSCVLSDREGGVRDSVSHLIDHGHRRIALVNAAGNYRRTAGYRQALAEHGLPVDERLIRTWSDRDGTLFEARRNGSQAICALLEEKIPFTAVQAGSDFTAVGAIDALREAGLRAPEDVAVVGFDNVDVAGLTQTQTPFLTTVADPNHEMGRKAAELLLTQIEDGAAPQRVVLPTELVVRRSCGEHPT